jgi:hypothetical protein
MTGNGMAAFPALDSVSCRTATGHTKPPDEWPIFASVLQKRTDRSPPTYAVPRSRGQGLFRGDFVEKLLAWSSAVDYGSKLPNADLIIPIT